MSEAPPPPPVQVMQMMMGMWVAQIAATTARLGIADHIAGGHTSADAMARQSDADPAALRRFLRAAATAGLVTENANGTFALTPLGDCLRRDVPYSIRDFLIAETAPGHWLPWGRLHDAVKSGAAVATETLGMPVWEYYAKNQEEGLTFARGMGNLSAMVSADVAPLYDPSRFTTIVDVGGSQGVLLNALLARAPNARGILFDRPEIIASVTPSDRVELARGDFFAAVPKGGDLYVLKSILHDWDDEHCDQILRNVRSACGVNARILLVETILPPAPQPSPVTFMDMNMLVMLGGRERTAEEYGAMLERAGFTVTQVIPTPGMFGLIEAVAS